MKRSRKKQGRLDVKNSIIVLIAFIAIMYWLYAHYLPDALEQTVENAKNFKVGK